MQIRPSNQLLPSFSNPFQRDMRRVQILEVLGKELKAANKVENRFK